MRLCPRYSGIYSQHDPSKSVLMKPHEMWTGRKRSLSYLKKWGCPTYVLTEGSKLEPRYEMCYFVGSMKTTRGSYFYFLSEQKVLVAPIPDT